MENNPETRITKCFSKLKKEGRSGLITFLTAGDPDEETSLRLINGLPKAGADLIEIGMPFSDPMADGPAIQASSLRALANGMTLAKTINLVKKFRETDFVTPIILMGYFNPIYIYGVDRFLDDAKESGVDGLIMVDLPPEEERELCLPAIKAGINFIYLTAPTTTAQRLPRILENASGFIYYVSIAGITGTNTASLDDINVKIKNIKAKTTLPIAVGFGIRSPEQAKNIAKIADAAVVGSALVDILKENLDTNNKPLPSLIKNVLSFVRLLAQQIRATTS